MKYGSGNKVYDMYKQELRELKDIMSEYNIPSEAQTLITDMFTEPYYQWNKACACGRALERMLGFKDKFNAEKFQEYLAIRAEEEACYPFSESEEEYTDNVLALKDKN